MARISERTLPGYSIEAKSRKSYPGVFAAGHAGEFQRMNIFRGIRHKETSASKEEGTTTTPFDMTVRNDPDRFHLVMSAIDRLPHLGARGADLKRRLDDKRIEHRRYIEEHGEDLPEIRNWRWKGAG